MPTNFVNPYNGKEEETCSVSFISQQQMNAHTTGSPQTEAEFNKSKQLGEWGVIKAKLAKGDIPDGTKVLTYSASTNAARGYLYVQNGELQIKHFSPDGKSNTSQSVPGQGETFIKSPYYSTSIPQAVEPKLETLTQIGLVKGKSGFVAGQVLGMTQDGQHRVVWNGKQFSVQDKADAGWQEVAAYNGSGGLMAHLNGDNLEVFKTDAKGNLPGGVKAPKTPVIASPTPSSAVNSASTSVGSMSHEDVAAMFVKIKDDLAKEKGLNIKGANPELDKVVYDKIGAVTGYTGVEVKGKIDAYKADGNKLSALKKKVLAGTKTVPTPIAHDPKPVNPPKITPGTPSLPKPDTAAPISKKDALAALAAMPVKGKYIDGGTDTVGMKFVTAYQDQGGVNLNKAIEKWTIAQGDNPNQANETLAEKYGYVQYVDTAKTQLYTNQEWLYPAVVKKYINAPGEKAALAVKLDGKIYIIDGNHRAAAAVMTNSPLKALVLDLDKHATKDNSTPDAKPNGVPTVATAKAANEIKAEVAKEVDAAPAKHYSDEDVAGAYIIAKDAIVASNTKGWTLYTKNDEFDLEIAIQVGLKTGLNPLQQKQAIANYLASGKKLSALKKQLAKQGAFTPKADSLKKSGAVKTQEDKNKDVEAKADAGYTPTPTPATAAKPPVDTGKPAPKAVEKEAEQSGDISGISDTLKKTYFDKFKAQYTKSYLSSTSGENYEAFTHVLTEMKLFGHSKDLTLLQLIRVVDEHGANKAGVDNGKLFEKKVVTWLTTPEGTQYIKDNEAKLAKQAEQAKKKAEAEAAAKLLEANQPPLPADSALFQEMTPNKALSLQLQMLKKQPFGPGEKQGLVRYTGSSYSTMNGHLRGLSTGDAADIRAIEQAKRAMRPSPEHILVRRGTGANQFMGLGVTRGETELLWGLTGRTFKDEGFLSTSAAERSAFSGEVSLEIECPTGTPMMYVDKLQNEDGTTSRFSSHPGENEMLLQAGLEYKILNVRKEGSRFIMRMRVVNWPGKE